MKSIGRKKSTDSAVIAVCGNPNCGKTTIFNAITGLNQHVGNYPGVTVDKVVGQFTSSIDSNIKYDLVDIPGTYSLSAFTPDEYIAASALFGEIEGENKPDGVIAVIDATNLERGFYFLLQILEIGCPVIVVLNMIDLVKKRGLQIDSKMLSDILGVDVVEVVGNKGVGIEALKAKASTFLNNPPRSYRNNYGKMAEALIEKIHNQFDAKDRTRAQIVRIIFDINGEAEKKFIEREGQKGREVLENGRNDIKNNFGALTIAETHLLISKSQKLYDTVVSKVNEKAKRRSDKVDKFLLHPVLGPVILAAMMVFIFQSIFSWAEPFMNLIDGSFGYLAGLIETNMNDGPFRSLLADGIIGGVGSVLVFIPQIAFLFIFISVLEDSGYMPRAAFLVDRMFHWCGLSGKSFIPMLSSFACAVPGIMATRTIEDRKLRLITITIAPLMTCSARLPVYAIMIAAFIPYKPIIGFINLQGLVLMMLYLLGVIVAIIVSFVLKKTLYKGERGTFMMEMPSYKIPTLKSVFIRVYNRLKSFVLRAGTVIMAITIIIWALSYYPRSEQLVNDFNLQQEQLAIQYESGIDQIDEQIDGIFAQSPGIKEFQSIISERLAEVETKEEIPVLAEQLNNEFPQTEDLISLEVTRKLEMLNYEVAIFDLSNRLAGEQIRNSYFGKIGKTVEPLFEPLGWDWKITMSVLASFPAREVIIAILGTIYNLGGDVDEESDTLMEKMRNARWEDGAKLGQPVFTPAVALSIMVFFALCCQCGATLVTIKQETKSWFHPLIVFLYMTLLAYLGGFIVYQIFSKLGF